MNNNDYAHKLLSNYLYDNSQVIISGYVSQISEAGQKIIRCN